MSNICRKIFINRLVNLHKHFKIQINTNHYNTIENTNNMGQHKT